MRSRSSSVQFITAGHSIQPRLYDIPGYLHAYMLDRFTRQRFAKENEARYSAV